MFPRLHVAAFVASIVIAILTGVSCVTAAEVKDVLAPNGKLRVGVYPGSPLSMTVDAKTGEKHGIAFDLGRELAQWLGVFFEPVVHPRIADILSAMKAGEVDFTISNITALRAQNVDFSQPLLSLELGYLVGQTSAIATIEEIDRTGVRIGVAQGSTSEGTLPKLLRKASVVSASTLTEAIRQIASNQLQGFATNKAILFEMAGELPGARILDGRWGVERIGTAIPKGRDAGLGYVRRFVEEARQKGNLTRAIERAGLRGTISSDEN